MSRSARYHLTRDFPDYVEVAHLSRRDEAIKLAKAYAKQGNRETITVIDTYQTWRGLDVATLFHSKKD